MESRCYHGGKGRTKMKILRFEGSDWLVLASMALVLAGCVALNLWLGPVS